MKNFLPAGLLALGMVCAPTAWADSGAADRNKAFGYAFTDEQLNDSFPQLTNLPTVYLQIYKTEVNDDGTSRLRLPSDPGDYSSDCPALEALNYIFNDDEKHDWYYRSKITIRDDWGTIKERNEWLGVRGRGNSTWFIGYTDWNTYWQPKKPFRLKFDKKADLLTGRNENGDIVNDYATDKSWTLLANYYDATLIRNGLATALQKRMGMTFVPAVKYVDLVINNQYFGTYQISDQVNITDRRVPINEDSGYFFEGNVKDPNGRFQEDPYFAVSFGGSSDYGADFLLNVKNPDPDAAYANATDANGKLTETSDPKYDEVKAKLTKVAKLLYNPQSDPNDNWRRYVDMESAVDAFIVLELSANYDATYGNNYFYMNNIDSRIVFGPLWDLDLTWNYKIDGKDIKGKHFWEFKKTPFSLLCEKAYNDPYFMKAVYERWQEVNSGLADFLQSTAQKLKQTVSQSAVLNYKERSQGGAGAYYNLSSWNDNNYYNSLDDAYQVMSEFITDRTDYVQTAFQQQYDALGCANLEECTEHNYADCMFALQADGTYRRVCNVCAQEETDGDAYYYFTVYPESNIGSSFYAKSWKPDEATPNAIATVEVDGSVVPEGYNIVNVRKDAAGNKTCADLHLVDGHPFYCDDKFVAAKAAYSRTVANNWGTIILPFDLQQYEAGLISFYSLGEVTTDAEGRLTLVMAEASSVKGYTPVFFKSTSEDVTVTAENVSVAKVGKKLNWASTTFEGWTLTGVMQPTAFSVADEAYAASDYYYISKNQFWHATGNLTTKPFRAYLATAKSTHAARSLRIATADEPLAVRNVAIDDCLALFAGRGQLDVVAPRQMDVTVSTLGGMLVRQARLQSGERMQMQLPQGVYVVNGVKVIVK